MNTYLTHTADAQLTGFKKPLISSGLWRKHTISSTEAPSTFVDAYLAALDKVCMGLCHVTRSGYVVHANKAAIELIDRSPLVGITSKNCLTFKDRQLSMSVQSGIAEAQKSDSDDVKSINAFLCGGLAGCSNSRLIVEISATRKALRKVTDLLGEVLVSLTDPDSVHALSTERIGILYKLSPAEKEVCTLYVSG
ncbi:MAG: hypothetical protein KTR35_18740, partial [Gammaproteobacteria bacterium]|nr:hypothetical protein [Gammaproteobacteria bacterium]